jgi:hypothetical protein
MRKAPGIRARRFRHFQPAHLASPGIHLSGEQDFLRLPDAAGPLLPYNEESWKKNLEKKETEQ